MSTFEDKNYRWRETYFVLFSSRKRPTVTQLERAIGQLNDRFDLVNLQADDEGRFESVTLHSPEDFSALDICYVEGEEVTEQVNQLVEELQDGASGAEKGNLKKVANSDARLDILHFQDVSAVDAAGGEESEEQLDEMFDPSALLVVLEALVDLTQGVAIDPQSGTMV
jgi:hypothetical protein